LISESCLRSREFSVGSGKDTELDCYTKEISHCEQFCDIGLAFWQDKHCQNSFSILGPVALDLVAAPALQAYVECVFCVQASVTV